MTHDRMSTVWPAAGAIARSGGIELRWIDDELALDLAEVAIGGIHPPEEMPFNTPWTRGTPTEITRSVLYWIWTLRGTPMRTDFHMPFGVIVDGKPAGIQGLQAPNWPAVREIETSSWIGKDFQGRGIGTRMRIIALHAAFVGLGADDVRSGAFIDNPASNRVSEKTGYEPDGIDREFRDGRERTAQRYRITRAKWEAMQPEYSRLLGEPVELIGYDLLRAQLDANRPETNP